MGNEVTTAEGDYLGPVGKQRGFLQVWHDEFTKAEGEYMDPEGKLKGYQQVWDDEAMKADGGNGIRIHGRARSSTKNRRVRTGVVHSLKRCR